MHLLTVSRVLRIEPRLLWSQLQQSQWALRREQLLDTTVDCCKACDVGDGQSERRNVDFQKLDDYTQQDQQYYQDVGH